jgi:large subunit ribosomal protein L5
MINLIQVKPEAITRLREKLEISNILALPKILKVVVAVGIGQARFDQNLVKEIEANLIKITGQKPVSTKSRKSIAGFKVRQGDLIGLKVTLRGKRMIDFLHRLINLALPRIRDFRGITQSQIDQGGNLNLGIKEHIIFPEIHQESVEKVHGLNITVCTDAHTREQAFELFKAYHFPMKG